MPPKTQQSFTQHLLVTLRVSKWPVKSLPRRTAADLTRGLRCPLLRVWVGAVTCLFALAQGMSHAQTDFTQAPFIAIVGVTPVVAAPNTPRTVTVTGIWPNSCLPGNATIADDPLRRSAPLIIRLQTPQTLAPCLAALMPYSVQATYTPAQGGARRLIAVTSESLFLGQGDLVTQESAKARSLHDLTGVWYDPVTSGSGLTFVHNFYGSDVLVGGWYFYDSQGKSRWYGIQMGEWATPSLFVAMLLEHDALPGGCATGVTACPLPSSSFRQFGTVRIQVIDRDHAVIDASTIMGGDVVVPLFRSTITRLGL